MKNSNDTIGNRTRDLLACSAVHQPTAPPRASIRKDKRRDNKRGRKNIDNFLMMTPYSVNESELFFLLKSRQNLFH